MKRILVPAYHSLKDPILEGHLLKYLQVLGKSGNYEFVLMTFEQGQYALVEEERKKKINELQQFNIYWKPKKYRTGGPFMLFKKGYNFLEVLWESFSQMRSATVVGILAFTSVSGALGTMVSMISSKPMVIFCFEPHSLYMVDFGIWKRSSLNYRVLHWLERLQVRIARDILVPTEYSKKLIEGWGREERIHIMPFCVDQNDFERSESARDELRNKYLIEKSNRVILYLGKFSGIYYPVKDVLRFFCDLYNQNEDYFFLIITPNAYQTTQKSFQDSIIPTSNYKILDGIDLTEVPKYLSAADVGFLAVPPFSSQRYRSPIKTANYLLCGLPYIVNEGIADDDELAIKHNVGVVIEGLDREQAHSLHMKLEELFTENIDSIRNRARGTGLKYRRLELATELLSNVFDELSVSTPFTKK